MRPVNPYAKFFTEDLYPDVGEVGNVFWGWHVSNNFSRILGISGTVYVPMGQSIDISTEGFNFISAPVLQLFSIEDDFGISTIFTDATFTGGSIQLAIDARIGGQTVYQTIWTNDGNNPPAADYSPGNGCYLKIGDTSNEMMSILGNSHSRYDHGILANPRYQWDFRWLVTRGALGNPPESYSADSPVYTIGSVGTQGVGVTVDENHSWAISISINGSTFTEQPIWIEAYLDYYRLKIKNCGHRFDTPLSPTVATVIYKLFGA